MASTRDIRLPADSVTAFRSALSREVGGRAAAAALRNAGHAAGDALYQRLTRGGDDPAGASSAAFWDRLAGLFREMGWGSIEHQELHPGVGAILARDWFEVEEGRRPGCHFTTGVLANLLGRIAGGEVAVLPVECGPDEPRCCRFLFGGGPALQEIYTALRDGRDLDAALGALR